MRNLGQFVAFGVWCLFWGMIAYENRRQAHQRARELAESRHPSRRSERP